MKKKSKTPSKEEVIWALEHPDTERALDVNHRLTNHPDWSRSALCRCPLCGYETTVTNIHRSCPEAPTIVELVRQKYCYTHKTVHVKNGKFVDYASVLMYVVEDVLEK